MDGKQAFAVMSAVQAATLKVADGDHVSLRQNDASTELPARVDNAVPDGCVWVPAGLPETQVLGDLFGAIEVSKA